MPLLIIINTIIFTLIAALHIYWALGGKRFLKAVLPTNTKGQSIFQPKFSATLLVAVGLVAFALITLGNLGIFDDFIPGKYINYGTYGIAAIFFLRAIGDFKFVGFTKKIKGTEFASNDSKIYSPLCLYIGLTSLAIAVLN